MSPEELAPRGESPRFERSPARGVVCATDRFACAGNSEGGSDKAEAPASHPHRPPQVVGSGPDRAAEGTAYAEVPDVTCWGWVRGPPREHLETRSEANTSELQTLMRSSYT